MPARSRTESNQISAPRLRGCTEWPRPAGGQWVRCVVYAGSPAGWDQIMVPVSVRQGNWNREKSKGNLRPTTDSVVAVLRAASVG